MQKLWEVSLTPPPRTLPLFEVKYREKVTFTLSPKMFLAHVTPVTRLRTPNPEETCHPICYSRAHLQQLICCVEALELASNLIPCLPDFHQFPNRHAEVDDWSDDCGNSRLCFEISSQNDAVAEFLP